MRFMVSIACFFVLASAGLAQSTWYVPDDFPGGIQDAISDASVVNGDTIIVRSGKYVETISFEGKDIILKSESGPFATIIDGGASRSVVVFSQSETAAAVLEGFTLTNGDGTSAGHPNFKGGGVSCINGSSPTITGNIIADNVARKGGAVYCDVSSPVISGNTMTGNAANWGGAIGLHGSSPTITGNFMVGNSSAHDGGAIDGSGSMPRVAGNVIANNHADDDGGGINIYFSTGPFIANNIFYGNTCDDHGGGLYSFFSTMSLANNTFSGNTAANAGGGAHFYGNTAVLICNTILWGNDSPTGAELALNYQTVGTLFCCDIQGGQAAAYISPACTITWGAGMIDADPLFADPGNGDYHLTHGSPCRNAGLNHAVLPDDDCEGDPRVVGGRADIGADEFYYHLYLLGRATYAGWISIRVAGPPGAWVVLGEGAGLQDPPSPSQYGPVYIAQPWTTQFLGTIPSEGILVLPFSLPTSWAPGEKHYFQAAVGATITRLTNLMTIEVTQ